MDEYILDDNEQSTETVVPSTESVETDKSDSENTVVTDSDRVSDSGGSDGVNYNVTKCKSHPIRDSTHNNLCKKINSVTQ